MKPNWWQLVAAFAVGLLVGPIAHALLLKLLELLGVGGI
jgi:hypothetical protein